MSFQKVDKILASCTFFFLPEGVWFNFKSTILKGKGGGDLCNCFITVQLLFSNWLMYKNTSDNRVVIYCGITEFHGGLIFVDFVDTSHPRINNLHEWINQGFKIIHVLPFVGIRGYTKLRLHEPVMNFKQSAKIGHNEFLRFHSNIMFRLLLSVQLHAKIGINMVVLCFDTNKGILIGNYRLLF